MSVVITERPDSVPLKAACSALGLNRSSVYARRRRASERSLSRVSRKTAPQPRALPPDERQRVHETLTSPEFCNQPPVEVYQTLLERGVCLCSVSTMHRILREHGENGERRDQRAAQHNAIPRLIAQAPNEVWTWDCSKLATRARSVYLTLYVVLDLFSRFVLAWMVSRKENSALAQQLMAEATARYRIDAGQLTIHQDRGAPMTANRYIDLLSDMGVVLSPTAARASATIMPSARHSSKPKSTSPITLDGSNTAHTPGPGARHTSIGTTSSTIMQGWLVTHRSKSSPGAIGRSLPTNSAPWINAIPLTRSDLFAGIRRPLRHHHAS